MLEFITGLLPGAGSIYAALAGLIAVLLGGTVIGASNRKRGKEKAELDALKAAVRKGEAGNEAESEARVDLQKGKTPEQIVRENDEAWR